MKLTPDVVELLEMVAVHRAGEGPLFSGAIEASAALYEVSPHLLEHARVCLASPDARLEAATIIAQARRMSECDNTVDLSHPVMTSMSDVPALVADAEAVPHGLELLTREPAAMAAVLFGAHPYVVEEARAYLAQHSPAEDEPHDSPMEHGCCCFSTSRTAQAPEEGAASDPQRKHH